MIVKPSAMRFLQYAAVAIRREYSNSFSTHPLSKSARSLDSVRIAMKTKDLTFSEMFNTRLEQASRSVCIQLQSVQEAPAVYHSCAQYGNVSGLYVGVLNTVYALVEFADDESVQEFLNSASFFARADQVPIRSKFLYRIGRNQRIGRQFRAQVPFIIEEQDTLLLDGLRKCQTVSQQIDKLVELTQLGEVGLRTRFFMADALQTSIRLALPFVTLTPFGSTINSMGTRNSDLDVSVRLDVGNVQRSKASGFSDMRENEFRFLTVTFDTESKTAERQMVTRLLEFVGTYARLTMPKCLDMFVLRKARVPIVHFRNHLTGVSIDLSAHNDGAVDMGELLYNLSWLEPRFTALALTLKRIAKVQQLNSDRPAQQLTGFMLACMLIHFMQTRAVPMLCPLRVLVKPSDPSLTSTPKRVFPTRRDADNASSNGEHDASEHDNSSSRFVPNGRRSLLQKVRSNSLAKANTESNESLLVDFLRYFVRFDYEHSAIDLYDGTLIENVFGKPFTLLNPLDHNHIITQSLTASHIKQMCTVFERVADELEKHSKPTDGSDQTFGLLRVLSSPLVSTASQNATTTPSTTLPSAEPTSASSQKANPSDTTSKDALV